MSSVDSTKRMAEWLVGLPSQWKVLIAGASDVVVVLFALWLSFWLRLGEPVAVTGKWWPLFVAAPLATLPIFAYFSLYRVVVRHLGSQILWMVAKSVALAVLAWMSVTLLLHIPGLPRSIIFIYAMLVFLLVGTSRLVACWFLRRRTGTRVAIYGADSAGVQLAHALQYSSEVWPVVFLDDAPELQGSYVAGLSVCNPDEFEAVHRRYGVKEVLVAIALHSRDERNRLVDKFKSYPVRVRVIPLMPELVRGRVSLADFQQINVEDLLGRDPVPPRRALLEADTRERSVLVTGAGGSIGSELCCQIAKIGPRRLVMLDQSESALYEIDHRLRGIGAAPSLIPVLGSVLDSGLVRKVLDEHSVETLYHAAAYKHVSIVEDNVVEGVRNNTLGTCVVAEAALKAGVTTFVLISTDKAVRPRSIMGASKRLAELSVQRLSASGLGETRFSIVRFGNVLGSSGSVVPLFRRQIENREQLTVTDPDATRYFMTVKEAVELVIQAGAMAKGGEIFVLDMGKPVRIGELARKMIYLSGLEEKDADNPEGDIEIRYTGLKPGEKKNEELLTGSNVLVTDHPKILLLQSAPPRWAELASLFDGLGETISARRPDKVRSLLFELVSKGSKV